MSQTFDLDYIDTVVKNGTNIELLKLNSTEIWSASKPIWVELGGARGGKAAYRNGSSYPAGDGYKFRTYIPEIYWAKGTVLRIILGNKGKTAQGWAQGGGGGGGTCLMGPSNQLIAIAGGGAGCGDYQAVKHSEQNGRSGTNGGSGYSGSTRNNNEGTNGNAGGVNSPCCGGLAGPGAGWNQSGAGAYYRTPTEGGNALNPSVDNAYGGRGDDQGPCGHGGYGGGGGGGGNCGYGGGGGGYSGGGAGGCCPCGGNGGGGGSYSANSMSAGGTTSGDSGYIKIYAGDMNGNSSLLYSNTGGTSMTGNVVTYTI